MSPLSPENIEVLSTEETRQMLHEPRVHLIELEMQNEELRLAHAELAAARTCYFDIYDLAPVGYFILSEKGLILEANLTAAVPRRPGIPIILCTGFSADNDEQRTRAMGIKGLLMKPVATGDLAEMVRKVLDEVVGSLPAHES